MEHEHCEGDTSFQNFPATQSQPRMVFKTLSCNRFDGANENDVLQNHLSFCTEFFFALISSEFSLNVELEGYSSKIPKS